MDFQMQAHFDELCKYGDFDSKVGLNKLPNCSKEYSLEFSGTSYGYKIKYQTQNFPNRSVT